MPCDSRGQEKPWFQTQSQEQIVFLDFLTATKFYRFDKVCAFGTQNHLVAKHHPNSASILFGYKKYIGNIKTDFLHKKRACTNTCKRKFKYLAKLICFWNNMMITYEYADTSTLQNILKWYSSIVQMYWCIDVSFIVTVLIVLSL